VDLIEPPETVEIAIEQVACLGTHSALAITRSDPGDNLDLTRDTPIWALVETIRETAPPQSKDIEEVDTEVGSLLSQAPQSLVVLKGGEGIGKQVDFNDQPAIYAYARRLIETNLQRWLRSGEQIQVTIILPEGQALAERTSNAAFGVVEGLSLLGTSGIAQPLSAPGQLEVYRQELQQRQQWYDGLVFCIGENGLDLARQCGVLPDRLIKTANWLGSMLVEAGLQGVQTILLFGYHGKLIKLAGGIFHTHHHVADGRQEILAAYCANLGLPTPQVQAILASTTTEAALQFLQHLDATTGGNWVTQVYGSIAQKIDRRAEAYIQTHSQRSVQVGCVLFDRQRQIFAQSKAGAAIFSQICQYS
jgi:cobalt-precorrin-5B (C1)-methyltransferase